MALTPIKSAIILAGGSGTRMWPYAEVRNKCAMPIANVPNVRRIADQLSEIGIANIVVVQGPHPGSIRSALVGAKANIAFVDQPAGGGAAGATLEGLKLIDDDKFLVVYGDTVTTAANVSAIAAASDREGAVLWDEIAASESGDWYAAHVND